MSGTAENPPSGPILPAKPRKMMESSYTKQRKLDKLVPEKPNDLLSLESLLEPLKKSTKVDFYAMHVVINGYEEDRKATYGSMRNVPDLDEYFVDQDGRIHYSYVERFVDPKKNPPEKRKDYHVIEEDLVNGKIMAIFDYGVKPHRLYDDASESYVEYRKLLSCVVIIKDDSGTERAVDLISGWTGASTNEKFFDRKSRADRELKSNKRVREKYPEAVPIDIASKASYFNQKNENRIKLVGVTSKNTPLDPNEQTDILKEKGYFLFGDSQGSEKWIPLLQASAAFSQNEGDKTDNYMRSDLTLGAIRMVLGESRGGENELIQQFLQSAYRQAGGNAEAVRQILGETRDWVRNRLAVTLFTLRKFHKFGIDFLSADQYRSLDKKVHEIMDRIEAETPLLENEQLSLRGESDNYRKLSSLMKDEKLKNFSDFILKNHEILKSFERDYDSMPEYDRKRLYNFLKKKIDLRKEELSTQQKNEIGDPVMDEYKIAASFFLKCEYYILKNTGELGNKKISEYPQIKRWADLIMTPEVTEEVRQAIEKLISSPQFKAIFGGNIMQGDGKFSTN